VATMGIRCYKEVAIVFLVLSAAVNSLWLQGILKGSALYLSKLLSVGLPLVCISMTRDQLLGWEHITVFFAAISLAPLLIMPVAVNSDAIGGMDLDKFQLRLGSLCGAGALFATIVNLALL